MSNHPDISFHSQDYGHESLILSFHEDFLSGMAGAIHFNFGQKISKKIWKSRICAD